MRHDPNVPLGQLAWNRLDGPYWFHYTTVTAADAIVRTEAYIVGDRAASGLYVTDIMPGQLTDDGMLNALLDGTRQLARVQAAVVLHDDETLPLVRDDDHAWVHAAPPGTVIDLSGVVVGYAFKEDGFWHYERSLWDF